MIRWNNDYNHGALPEILEALEQTNDTAFGGYGIDTMCEAAAAKIKELCVCDADVHFLVGGTQANFTLIDAALRPYQSPICAVSGHINGHETGAVEATRHKILPLPAKNGKISAEQVEELALGFEASGVQEHITMPKLVYISHPTELGTLYSKEELTALRETCDRHGLYFYLDGARLAYAFGSAENDLSISDIANLTDAFYIGGTKCGALFGEALVIRNDELKPCFRSYIKMNGGMLAKGWLLGLQFYTLFMDGLYFRLGERADRLNAEIKKAFKAKGVECFIENSTNQLFVILTNEQMKLIGEKHIYEFQERIDEERCCVRFCTSWSTAEDEVNVLINDIRELL